MTSSNIGFYDPAKELRPLQTGDTPLEFVYPFFGLGCFSLGIYLESYHTCGCASRAMFLTSNWEQLTCKPARYPNSTNSCCTTNETKCECFWPPTFFKVWTIYFLNPLSVPQVHKYFLFSLSTKFCVWTFASDFLVMMMSLSL